eukprot:10908559-Karenia_brevis.AAC.1
MTAVADSLLSAVVQNRAGHGCVAGVANPFRCAPDAFVDVLVCATPVADSAPARALGYLRRLEIVTPVADLLPCLCWG